VGPQDGSYPELSNGLWKGCSTRFTAEASNIIHLGDARTFRFCYSRIWHKTKSHTTKANPPRGRGRKTHGSLQEIARLPKGDGSGNGRGNVRGFAVINERTRRRHPERCCSIGGGGGTAPRGAEGRPPRPSHPSRTGQVLGAQVRRGGRGRRRSYKRPYPTIGQPPSLYEVLSNRNQSDNVLPTGTM
jgi:hypothetical protein